MLSSKAVKIGATLGLLVGGLACAEGEEQPVEVRTEWGVICVVNPGTVEETRVDDAECNVGGGGTPAYVDHRAGHAAPAVGQKTIPGSTTTTAPNSGSTAKPPASGGFGTHSAVVGG